MKITLFLLTMLIGFNCYSRSAENNVKKMEYLKRAQSLLKIGIEMQDLRNNEQVMKCMPLMRKYKPQAEALDEEVSTLSNNEIDLKVAATELRLCLVCLKGSADHHCNQARIFFKQK